MGDSLRNYALGEAGVNVDKSPLHLDDNELTKAQNAIRDPLGLDGGLRKRAGLKHFNGTSLSGSVLGAASVPIPLLVSTINGTTFSAEDPAADDGDAGGSAVGTPGIGAGAGGGGGTGDGGGAIGTSTPTAGVPSRKIFWARTKSTTTELDLPAAGWWISSDGFTGAAAENNSNPDYISTRAFGAFASESGFCTAATLRSGAPASAVVVGNKLYYAGNPNITYKALRSFDSTGVANDKPGIRCITPYPDGSFQDVPVCSIPPNPAVDTNGSPPPTVWNSGGVLSMITANGFIYFTTGEGATMRDGRVWRFNPTNSDLVQLGAAFSSGMTPYALCYHNARLWVGTYDRVGVPTVGSVYWIGQEGENITLDWTLDRAMTSGRGISTMCSHNGYLYVGSDGSGSEANTIEQRDATGTWTTSLSYNPAVGNTFLAAISFNNALYVVNFAFTGFVATIRKFDNASWSTVFTGTKPLHVSWIEQGVLFFGGGADGTDTGLQSSPDGTSWTSRAGNLTNNSGFTHVAGRTIVGTLVF